jgi:hypothetical protein
VADETPNTYERDDNGLVTIHLGSTRVVKVKELSQNEADLAERLMGAVTDNARSGAWTRFAVREIDGVKLDPKSKADLERVGDRFTTREFGLLQMEYALAFRNEEIEQQAKNAGALLEPSTP